MPSLSLVEVEVEVGVEVGIEVGVDVEVGIEGGVILLFWVGGVEWLEKL